MCIASTSTYSLPIWLILSPLVFYDEFLYGVWRFFSFCIPIHFSQWATCPRGHKKSDMTEWLTLSYFSRGSQVALVVKNLPSNGRKCKSSIPGSGRSPGGGHRNPLQYSCLENPMDRGAWQATVHRVTKSQSQLKQRSMHAHYSQTSFHLDYSWVLHFCVLI